MIPGGWTEVVVGGHAGRTSAEALAAYAYCNKCLGVALQETLIAFCIEHGVMKN